MEIYIRKKGVAAALNEEANELRVRPIKKARRWLKSKPVKKTAIAMPNEGATELVENDLGGLACYRHYQVDISAVDTYRHDTAGALAVACRFEHHLG